MIDRANLRSTLEDAGGSVGCDVCGFDSLDAAEAPFRLVPVSEEGRADAGEGFDVLPMVCPKCSAVQLYSYPLLKRLAEDRAR